MAQIEYLSQKKSFGVTNPILPTKISWLISLIKIW